MVEPHSDEIASGLAPRRAAACRRPLRTVRHAIARPRSDVLRTGATLCHALPRFATGTTSSADGQRHRATQRQNRRYTLDAAVEWPGPHVPSRSLRCFTAHWRNWTDAMATGNRCVFHSTAPHCGSDPALTSHGEHACHERVRAHTRARSRPRATTRFQTVWFSACERRCAQASTVIA